MAWSFRKRLKLFPGLHLNLSKQGISTTVGVKGMSITHSPKGKTMNVGVPGTGLYSRKQLSSDGVEHVGLQHTRMTDERTRPAEPRTMENHTPVVRKESDPLLSKARAIADASSDLTPALLQDSLKISYSRACSLVKLIEKERGE